MINQLVKEFSANNGLTPRETDIIQLLAEQVVWLKDIAKALKVSPHTVNNHFKSIFEKTKTNSRTELMAQILTLAMSKFGSTPYLIRSPHIVVVDDEPDICEILSESLSAMQMKVDSFTSATKFLEHLPYLNPDVIISDIRMPDLNGIQLMAEVKRQNRVYPGIIFISGYAGDYDESDLMNLGAMALLDKPIDIKRLERLILEQFVENRIARNQILGLDKNKGFAVNRVFSLQMDNIGTGGIALRFDLNEELAELESLEVGNIVEFKFRIAPFAEIVQASGEVVWKRFVSGKNEQPSLGIKFLDLSEKSKAFLNDYLQKNKILSFIPYERDSETLKAP